MKTSTSTWTAAEGWASPCGTLDDATSAQLVLAFGAPACFTDPEVFASLHARHPRAQVLGCSTAGEIIGPRLRDDSLVAIAVHLEHSEVRSAATSIEGPSDSHAAGMRLAAALPHEGLVHVFVLSDGLGVNGSELSAGLAHGLPDGVSVTGGLAGDGLRFEATYVHAEGCTATGRVGVVGLYGSRLRVGFGSMGGWDMFGPERRVTRSAGNVLYELDGRSALDLYREYLGPHAEHLPASALLFPLAVRAEGATTPLVRSVLATDDSAKTMTFAGDVPMGATVRLMRTNFDRLVDGASRAATACVLDGAPEVGLALLVSCVGRKQVLKQRIEEELEAAADVFGPQATLAGFYSYGELAPFGQGYGCELHNQTMTITTLAEA